MPARCNSSAAKLGPGIGLVCLATGVQRGGTIQQGFGSGLAMNGRRPLSVKCSDGRPVRVRGNRKDKKHELHSMWPPVEASAKMRMRPVATLRESSGSTLPKSFPLLEEPPMPMGWGIADFCLIKRLCTPGQGRCWKGPGEKKSLACPHSLENAQVGVGDSFPLARPPAPKPSACRP